MISCFQDADVQIATLIKKIISIDELNNPNTPKVVFAANGDALYFSRQAIPFKKDITIENWLQYGSYFKHIGIYGYQSAVLTKLTSLPPGKAEQLESLEQLRWLENGYRIRTTITDMETLAIDTPEDLLKAETYL